MDRGTHHIAAELKPAKSAIFTLGSLFVAAFLMFTGAEYVAEGEYLAGLLLLLAGASAGSASYVLGFKSSKDQDLEAGHPFTISADADSLQLSADPRTSQDVMLSLIAATAETMKNRKPLPDPSGMVSSDGKGDGSRIAEANQVVSENNSSLQSDMIALEQALTVRQRIDSTIVDSAPKDNRLEARNSGRS